MNKELTICDMKEKKTGLGEDSNPILLCYDDKVVTGVLDGMGGAGGAECISDYGENHTKAYVGSRIIRDAIEKLITSSPNIIYASEFKESLKACIIARYAEEHEKYPPKSKGLRSALIKEYPTTLALACVYHNEQGYIIDSYWSGDSRNYIWTEKGLFKITIDDLKGNLDPLQNLHEDAPMSNCIQADAPFDINHNVITGFSQKDKFIVISATDGCFGYYPSPMDFEKILHESLKYSNNVDEWKEKLNKAFAYVTADDFSYSIATVGFKSFKDIKDTLKHYKNTQLREYCKKRASYEECVRQKRKFEEEADRICCQLEQQINDMWPEYKGLYLKYMIDHE